MKQRTESVAFCGCLYIVSKKRHSNTKEDVLWYLYFYKKLAT